MLFCTDLINIERRSRIVSIYSELSVGSEKCFVNKSAFTCMATVMKRNAAVRVRYGPCLITRMKP